MSNKEITQFIKSIQKVEYSNFASRLLLTVKYKGDDTFYYPQFPLPRGEYITEEGLRDPGFGQGPTKFCEIEIIRVPFSPHPRMTSVHDYAEMLDALREMVVNLKSVEINSNCIEFINMGI